MVNKPFNSQLFNNYIHYIKDIHPDIDITKVLNAAGIESWELDPGHWFSQEAVERFYYAAREATGNPNIAVDAAKHTANVWPKNFIREMVLFLLSPTNLYAQFGRLTSLYCKDVTATSKKISKNHYEIVLNWLEGSNPKKFQCDRYLSYVSGAPIIFGQPEAKVKHTECYFNNKGSRCVYHVYLEPSPSQRINLIIKLILCMSPVGLFLFSGSFSTLIAYILSAVSVVASLAWFSERKDKRSILDSCARQTMEPSDLYMSYAKYYNSAGIVSSVGYALSRITSVEKSIEKLAEILLQFEHSKGIIAIIDHDTIKPAFQTILIFNEQKNDYIDLNADQKKPDPFLLSPLFKKRMVKSLDHYKQYFPHWLIDQMMRLNFTHPVYLPIADGKILLGFIVLNDYEEEGLKAPDLNLLDTIASQTALHLINIYNYKKLLAEESAQKSFITNASHEMLMPIQIINAATYKVKSQLKNSKDSNLNNSLEILDKAVFKLNSLGKSLINLSNKVGQNLTNLTSVPLQSIVDAISKETQDLIEAYNHEFHIDIDSSIKFIKCNENQFIEMIMNFIRNAAKYTPQGGIIKLTIALSTSSFTISVCDNGIGVSPENQDKIFMRFFQVEPNESGAGVGLAYCKGVAKELGGYITISSPIFPEKDVRKGSEFMVHLPTDRISIQ